MKLWKMSPGKISDCFETLVNHNAITVDDYIFENHFLVLFWRRHKWFMASNYPKILRGLHKLNYNVFFLMKGSLRILGNLFGLNSFDDQIVG